MFNEVNKPFRNLAAAHLQSLWALGMKFVVLITGNDEVNTDVDAFYEPFRNL